MSGFRVSARAYRTMGRFAIMGGANTLLTYALYLVLLGHIPAVAAYSVVFVVSIAFTALLNRFFVFRAGNRRRTITYFPIVYIVQYVGGVSVVWLWENVFGLPASVGPVIAIMLLLPVNFVLSRRVFA